jgi:molybdopterin synthase sulfur carrier subunit
MAVSVQIPAPLRALSGGAAEVRLEAGTVRQLVDELQVRHAGFRERLLDDSGRLKAYVRVFVNQDDVRSLDNEATALRDGDVVAIVPAIAGGVGGLGAKPQSGGKPPVRRAGLGPDRMTRCCCCCPVRPPSGPPSTVEPHHV